LPDASGSSGDDDDSACYVHRRPLSQTEKMNIKKFLVENR
jgi:hypothetical protein